MPVHAALMKAGSNRAPAEPSACLSFPRANPPLHTSIIPLTSSLTTSGPLGSPRGAVDCAFGTMLRCSLLRLSKGSPKQNHGRHVARFGWDSAARGPYISAGDPAAFLSEKRLFQAVGKGVAPALRSYRRRTQAGSREPGTGGGQNRGI